MSGIEPAQIEVMTFHSHIEAIKINPNTGSSEITIHKLGVVIHVLETTMSPGDRVKITIIKEPSND